MKTNTLKTRIVELLATMPGSDASGVASTLHLPRRRVARLVTGRFSSRPRDPGYDLALRTLRVMETQGSVVSAKTLDGKRVWFTSPDTVSIDERGEVVETKVAS